MLLIETSKRKESEYRSYVVKLVVIEIVDVMCALSSQPDASVLYIIRVLTFCQLNFDFGASFLKWISYYVGGKKVVRIEHFFFGNLFSFL